MQESCKQLESNIIKAFFIVVAFLCFHVAEGQVMVVDATNRPIMPKEYINLKGSPYLYDDWVKGKVKLQNGIEYNDIYLMYDQVKDELNFTYQDGKIQKFVDPVTRFTLNNKEFRRDVMGKNKPLSKEFYEVLTEGYVDLLKRNSKKIVDEATHAVATKERRIYTSTSHYLLVNNELIKIKGNKNTVLKALVTHEDTLKAYIKKENLDLKNEQDLVKLIAYYNALNKE